MDTNSVKTPSEVNVKLKKRRRRRVKMKGNNGHVIPNMDQKDKNVDDFESGTNGTIAKDVQGIILEVDSATKLSQEHPKTYMVPMTNPLEKSAKSKKKRKKRAKKKAEHPNTVVVSTTNPLENSAKSKKKRKKRAKKKAEHKNGPQSVDHADILSNLSLADASDGHTDGKINNITGVSQELAHSMGKGSAISLSGPSVNLAQKDSGLVELCRHNHTASSLSLFDVSSYSICPQFLQERGELGFAIRNKEVTEHRSSELINEVRNDLLSVSYQIPQRRKLLILDVNGLLADIVKPAPQGRKADTNISGRAIFKRPFCYDFLKFCFERFDVGIWSSRSKAIIDKVVDYLLGDLKHKLLFCWDMFYCTDTGFRTLENRHKPLVLKELRKLWEKHDPNLPWEKGDYDESNTLLLDDSPYKALLNPIHTGVFPCSYSYKYTRDNSLGPGGALRVYLEGLAAAKNVQNYVAQHPFGQGAINETNRSWSFYSRVLHSFIIQTDKRGS